MQISGIFGQLLRMLKALRRLQLGLQGRPRSKWFKACIGAYKLRNKSWSDLFISSATVTQPGGHLGHGRRTLVKPSQSRRAENSHRIWVWRGWPLSRTRWLRFCRCSVVSVVMHTTARPNWHNWLVDFVRRVHTQCDSSRAAGCHQRKDDIARDGFFSTDNRLGPMVDCSGSNSSRKYSTRLFEYGNGDY